MPHYRSVRHEVNDSVRYLNHFNLRRYLQQSRDSVCGDTPVGIRDEILEINIASCDASRVCQRQRSERACRSKLQCGFWR